MRQKHKRKASAFLLKLRCKVEDFLVTDVIETHHHIDTDNGVEHLAGLCRSLHPHELWRVTQVKVNILPVDLSLNLTVFFKNVRVIVTADHQDLSHTELDEGLIVSSLQFLEHQWFYSIHIMLSSAELCHCNCCCYRGVQRF